MIRTDVKYYYDDESRNWGLVVPSLHIVGGGDTREEAEHMAFEAVAFTLAMDQELTPEPGDEVGHFWLTVHRIPPLAVPGDHATAAT